MNPSNGNGLADDEHARASQHRAHEKYLGHLSNLVSGGLSVSTSDGADLPPERALMRVAGALLKAVVVATFAECDGENLDAEGWNADSSTLSENEQHAALCGIVALLQDGSKVIEHLRDHDEFREGHERILHREAMREARIKLAGEMAIEAEDADDEGPVAS